MSGLWEARLMMPGQAGPERTWAAKKTIAIIVPCWNERADIEAFLDSLVASDFDRERTQILIVDGMSTDGTREIVKRYADCYPFLRMLDNPKRVQAAAMNVGIRNSSSEVVIRMDVRSQYPKDYVPRLVAALYRYGADNVGALRHTAPGNEPWTRAVSSLVSHPFGSGGALWRSWVKQPRPVESVYCGCFRREVFQRIGLLNEQLGRAEDREFNRRLNTAGGAVILDPTITCTYVPRTGLAAYCKWTFSGPLWLFASRLYTPTKLLSWRNYVPVSFLVYHFAVPAFYVFSPALFKLSLVPLVAYWFANVSVSLAEAVRYRDSRVAPLLMWGFYLTHLTYGLGSLAGLAKRLSGSR